MEVLAWEGRGKQKWEWERASPSYQDSGLGEAGRNQRRGRTDSPVAASPSSTHKARGHLEYASSLPPMVARLYLLTSLISVATELSCFSLWGWL